MKNLLLIFAMIFISAPQKIYSQIAPGSVLTDGTDEDFLQNLIGPEEYEGTLIFRMSEDGNNSSNFHSACDNQGPTLVIMRNSLSGEVFGGYTEETWAGSGYSNCGECFLFNLTHDYSLGNTIYPQYSIYRHPNYGPTFGGGHDLYVPQIMDSGNPYCNDHSYESPTNQGHDYLHGGSSQNDLTIDEIEVFKIILSPLPVELIEFKGRLNLSQINLEWSTASEISNLGFEIQKSRDGINWEKVGFIEGIGTSEEINRYDFSDNSPFEGISYYKLKQIDFDGKYEFSNVISFNLSKEWDAQIYPNPTKSDIKIIGMEEGQVTIIDNIGRTIIQTNFTDSRVDISALPSGIYFIQISSELKMTMKKLIKE